MAAAAAEGPSGSSCRLEFAVQMQCQSCAEAVRAALRGAPGVRLLELRLEAQTVLVETTEAAERVRELLENSGCRAVLKGMGGSDDGECGAGGGDLGEPGGRAVAALCGPGAVRGLVRFLQVSPTRCLVDGAVTGLPPGPHGLHVHEFGDLSRPCDSCGGHFNPDGERHGGPQDQHRHVGDLGNIWADAEGRASFRMEDSRLKVWDIIGRSVVVDAGEDDLGRGSHPLSRVTGNSGPGLACGVVARAAGLFQNPKRVCSCDGLTLWEERDRTPAAPGPTADPSPTADPGPTAASSPTAAPAPHL
ncbi:LOW QUALITY PROTEIN: copper chaperone for superoxide dismutase [Gavia stellata]|uniref:LOW QUALITY PROTEIN: copper chaperone for superoxide dismutase n=1 Tax=Gavia stellata TaxID=37040 RepID=UPI00289F9EFF|nr:LOW QUALITY PROTEIN: copper chaperone for superoxide dismutase [Gavia stellata]